VREVANPFDADVNNDWTNIQPLCDACYGELCDDAGQMDRPDLRPPSLVLGHLTITIPIVAIILLTLRVGYYTLGPNLWPYYITGGLGLGWQWYSLSLSRWKASMMRADAQDHEAHQVAWHNGLQWPGASAIGLLALPRLPLPYADFTSVLGWLVGGLGGYSQH